MRPAAALLAALSLVAQAAPAENPALSRTNESKPAVQPSIQPSIQPNIQPKVQASKQATGQPASAPVLRAQYQWGYAGADGQGKGTLSVLIEPVSGRLVLELQGLGERLMLLEGDAAAGYRVQIPRRALDQRAATLAGVPLPFLPKLGSPANLLQMLSEGSGAGVKVSKRDQLGPVKLRYQGVDEAGKEVLVWLERTRWEPAS